MPTSRIDIMTNDIKAFLLNSSFSITSKLLKFFIKMETNPIAGTQKWNPALAFTIGITKKLHIPMGNQTTYTHGNQLSRFSDKPTLIARAIVFI